MKILRTTYLIRKEPYGSSPEWQARYEEICTAIKMVEWPVGSGSFTLYAEKKSNGVVPIKQSCMASLKKVGWNLETRFAPAASKTPGPIDATYAERDGKLLCLEWETGNVSSSHRALNKMASGLISGSFLGGVLIIPSRAMIARNLRSAKRTRVKVLCSRQLRRCQREAVCRVIIHDLKFPTTPNVTHSLHLCKTKNTIPI